ncbi:hypothetical protein N7533_010323 [Penicillium manginii]|uniref:uncharacterized protein n=1 Tax=Penicillium manginii TaxID=203109 RepID=UPI002548FE6B|nr:uncharacterized protein N7533_010323 [Penicillium manginii]KAJ5743221.1 hypothetical protein N7533_010323 [Penicillium manginii]
MRQMQPLFIPCSGGSDNQPLSKLNRPRPKSSAKKKRGKHIFLESDDPLEKNIVDKSPMPDGYIFVQKGDVLGKPTFIPDTSTNSTLTKNQDKAGKRSFGIRVPSSIHSEVLKTAAETAESRAKAVKSNDRKVLSRGRQLLRSEFPLMPAATLDIVINHAFLKGSGRVGRTGMTTDKRKASLAVEAHIRHTHTPYDSLLDGGMERSDARKKVWPTVKAIKKSWEGDGDGEDGEQREDREGSVALSVISISSSLQAESVLSVESMESVESISATSIASIESLEWI